MGLWCVVVVERVERALSGSRLEREIINVHETFAELDACAEKCATCRLFRQSLLLNKPTRDGPTAGKSLIWIDCYDRQAFTENRPEKLIVNCYVKGSNTITAELQLTPDCGLQSDQISRTKREPLKDAAATAANANKGINMQRAYIHIPSVWSPLDRSSQDERYNQIRMWIYDCQSHPEGENLNWSTKNPTRLIEIVTETELRLVNIREHKLVAYSALSYCWGGHSSGRTLKGNLATQRKSFHLNNLPRTIKDAIVLSRGGGLKYFWADAVCIVQDEVADWSRESTLMQEVYANASVTICASSATHANAGLFGERAAWKYPSMPCKLGSYWLSIIETPFDSAISILNGHDVLGCCKKNVYLLASCTGLHNA